MKRKYLTRIFSVLLAALIITGGFSITAHAETPTETPTDDSGVKVDPQPLTPEGNMTLVDDIQGDAAKDKQFIVVQSRGGNYFYIIIDNAAEGENRVHFLNQVDEADLLSIIDEDLQSIQQQQTTPPVIEQPTPITEPEPTTQPEQEKPKENNSLYGLILFLLIAVLGGGGAIFYLKVIKPKQNVKGNTDLDEFDLEEWEDDEPEADVSEDDGIEYVDLDNGQEDEE
jgi:hypothetical protein